MSFAGRTAWITGASSGIGEALARELAGRGVYDRLAGLMTSGYAERMKATNG